MTDDIRTDDTNDIEPPYSRTEILLKQIKNTLSGGGGGGGGAGMVVNVPFDELLWTMDKTWTEIKDAIAAGSNVVVHVEDTEYVQDEYGVVTCVVNNSGTYYVYVLLEGSEYQFYCTSGSESPSYSFE